MNSNGPPESQSGSKTPKLNPSTPEADNQCPICFDDLGTDPAQLYPLACRHQFHRTCLTTWLQENSTCPLCRQPVTPEQRWVQDGLVTEERYRELINMGQVAIQSLADLIEYGFPKMFGLELTGYGSAIKESVNKGEFDNIIGELMFTEDHRKKAYLGLLLNLVLPYLRSNQE